MFVKYCQKLSSVDMPPSVQHFMERTQQNQPPKLARQAQQQQQQQRPQQQQQQQQRQRAAATAPKPAPAPEQEQELFKSTGNDDRDNAVRVLAVAMAGVKNPVDSAIDMERTLYYRTAAASAPAAELASGTEAGAGGGAPNEAYMKQLRAIWQHLSPRVSESEFPPIFTIFSNGVLFNIYHLTFALLFIYS
jgi:hypothetical protein